VQRTHRIEIGRFGSHLRRQGRILLGRSSWWASGLGPLTIVMQLITAQFPLSQDELDEWPSV
jgi:hypothetical protein